MATADPGVRLASAPLLSSGRAGMGTHAMQPRCFAGHAARHQSQAGFSLLELLIVLVIIGIATGLAGFSAFSGSEARALRQEATRLSQLFAIAQAEARAGGRPIRWEHDDSGYRFVRRSQPVALGADAMALHAPAVADDFSGDDMLRPRPWSIDAAPTVRITPPSAAWLTAEWLPPPMHIELDDGWSRVRIVRDGAGQYRVEQ